MGAYGAVRDDPTIGYTEVNAIQLGEHFRDAVSGVKEKSGLRIEFERPQSGERAKVIDVLRPW